MTTESKMDSIGSWPQSRVQTRSKTAVQNPNPCEQTSDHHTKPSTMPSPFSAYLDCPSASGGKFWSVHQDDCSMKVAIHNFRKGVESITEEMERADTNGIFCGGREDAIRPDANDESSTRPKPSLRQQPVSGPVHSKKRQTKKSMIHLKR